MTGVGHDLCGVLNSISNSSQTPLQIGSGPGFRAAVPSSFFCMAVPAPCFAVLAPFAPGASPVIEPSGRSWPADTTRLQIADLQVDLRFRQLVHAGQTVELTQRVFD